jgi:hypothetical protein
MACPCCQGGNICVSVRTCDSDAPTMSISAPGITAQTSRIGFGVYGINVISPLRYCQGSEGVWPNESAHRQLLDFRGTRTCLGQGRCDYRTQFSYRAWINFLDQRSGFFCSVAGLSYQEYFYDVSTDHGYVTSTALSKGRLFYNNAAEFDFFSACTNPSQPTWSESCVALYEEEVVNIQTPPTVTIVSPRRTGTRECRDFPNPTGCLSYSGCNYFIRLFAPCTFQTCSGTIDDAADLAACGFVPPNPLP